MERISGGAALVGRIGPETAREDDVPATPAAVFALCYRQMRSLVGRRDVDELAQAAAEKAIRALPSFAGYAKLSTWTFRICYLTVCKQHRWYKRWLRRFTLTDDGELPEASVDLPGADESMVQEERAARVRAALDQLSPKRRTVLVLHDLEGLPIDEVADIVGALPRAVRSRLRDGRNALAEILAADPYFGAEVCRRKEHP